MCSALPPPLFFFFFFFFNQRPLGWHLLPGGAPSSCPRERVSTQERRLCALAARSAPAPRVPARRRAACPRLGDHPTPTPGDRPKASALLEPLGAASPPRVPAYPRGRSKGPDVGAENQPRASAPSQWLPWAHVPTSAASGGGGSCSERGAGAQPGGPAGGGQRLSPGQPAGEPAARAQLCPQPPERIPATPRLSPSVYPSPPTPEVPINFLE